MILMLEPANPDGEIWDRLKSESANAYANFCTYRDLGSSRTFDNLLEIVNETQKKSKDALYKMSSKWNWIERAEAYDDYIDENFRTQNEKRILEMRRRHADNSKQLQEDLLTLKNECLGLEIEEEVFKSPGGKAWFLKQVADAYGQAVMIEQDALGEPAGEEDKAKRREEFVRLFQETEDEEDIESDSETEV